MTAHYLNEPRPRTPTTEMKLAAARRVCDRLASYGLIEARNVENCAADIAKHGRGNMDGYELAKTLDDLCYWDCNMEMVEELDGFSGEARRELETAQKAWAERNSISPPFPDGTRVMLKDGSSGVVDGIYEYGAAQFKIAVDGDPEAASPTKRRRIVNFEDVEATP